MVYIVTALMYLLFVAAIIAVVWTIIQSAVRSALLANDQHREKVAWARRHECPECGAPIGQGCIRPGKTVPDPVLRHPGRIALDTNIARVLPEIPTAR